MRGDSKHFTPASHSKMDFLGKKLSLRIALAPIAQGAAETGAEDLVQLVQGETAEVGDGTDADPRLPQQVEYALQAHLLNFVED